MTPEQRTQVEACKARIKYARQGGIEKSIVRANLIAEGLAAAAVDQAFDELDNGKEKR